MKVLLTTIGSTGDINPFIAVGWALQQRGQRAVLLVNPYYKEQVLAAGLEFLPLGREADLLRLKDMPDLLDPRKGAGLIWRELVLPNVPLVVEALEAALASGEPPDAVVYHMATLGARWVCQKHAVPCALAALSPLAWMSCKDGSVHSRALFRKSPPEWMLRLTLRAARPFLRWRVDGALNPIRARFGYAPARNIFLDHLFGSDLNLGLWSPAFRGTMADDPPRSRICGFTWFDGGHQVRHADDDVVRFMDAGKPPIVFTMGSTAVAVAGDFYKHAAEACLLLGRRGLLLTGNERNVPRHMPTGVKAFGYARFSAVLPRARAIVHHGGVGTAARALRAGKPTVVIPIVHDEFDNAARVERLGVSVTLQRARVSPRGLAAALRKVLENPAVAARAAEIGGQLAGEDGAVVAAEAVVALQEPAVPSVSAAQKT